MLERKGMLMLRYLAFAVATLFSAALCVYAQSSGSGAPPSQSSSSSPAPSGGGAAPSIPAKSPDKDTKKSKKVWTNDEISGLNGGVSVVGEEAKAKPPKSGNAQSGANASEISRLRKELQKLRADLEKIDKQIHDLKQFNVGETTGSAGMQLHRGYTTASIPDQIKQLEEKRKQIETRIAAIEDDARKRRIEPGQLR